MHLEVGYCRNEICAALRFTAKDIQKLFDSVVGHQEMVFTLQIYGYSFHHIHRIIGIIFHKCRKLWVPFFHIWVNWGPHFLKY